MISSTHLRRGTLSGCPIGRPERPPLRLIAITSRSEFQPSADARRTRRRHRGTREHARKVDDVQPVGDVRDLTANIETPPIAAPQLDADAEIDREGRPGAPFFEVDPLHHPMTIMRD